MNNERDRLQKQREAIENEEEALSAQVTKQGSLSLAEDQNQSYYN